MLERIELKTYLLAAVAAISLAGSAHALTQDEKMYVAGYALSGMMIVACPGFERDEDTPIKNSDKIGIDGVKLWDAARAALQAQFNFPYDRADLNPEVTREVVATMEKNVKDVTSARICKYTDTFVDLGWLKRKPK
jgi:opacity protein-like surface antigen